MFRSRSKKKTEKRRWANTLITPVICLLETSVGIENIAKTGNVTETLKHRDTHKEEYKTSCLHICLQGIPADDIHVTIVLCLFVPSLVSASASPQLEKQNLIPVFTIVIKGKKRILLVDTADYWQDLEKSSIHGSDSYKNKQGSASLYFEVSQKDNNRILLLYSISSQLDVGKCHWKRSGIIRDCFRNWNIQENL